MVRCRSRSSSTVDLRLPEPLSCNALGEAALSLAELEEEPLEFFHVSIAVRIGERGGHQTKADPVEGSLGRRQLSDDVLALRSFIDHPLKTTDLAFETAKTFDDFGRCIGREMHALNIPRGV
jgi:hypothetical protein